MIDPHRRPEPVADAPRPWETRGALRRDPEPHRGSLLRLVALSVFVLSVLALYAGVPGVLSLPLSVAIWVHARRDLVKMRVGLMDPDGRLLTEYARNSAFIGIILSSAGLLLWSAVWGAVLFRK